MPLSETVDEWVLNYLCSRHDCMLLFMQIIYAAAKLSCQEIFARSGSELEE